MPYNLFAPRPTGGMGFGSNPVGPPTNDDWQVMERQNQMQRDLMGQQQGFQAGQNAADRAQQTHQWDWQAGQNNLDRGLQQQQAQAGRDFQGSQANQQRTFEGTQADLQRAFQGSQNESDRALQLRLGSMPWDYKNQVFSTVSPLLTSLLSGGGGGGAVMAGGGGAGPGPATQAGPQPRIDAGPVWTQNQIQEHANAQKASNAAAAAGQTQGLQRQLAGQGFGSNSPLLAALTAGANQARMGADNAADRETSFMGAQANADQLLKGQQAQEGQWADLQQSQIGRLQAANQSAAVRNNYTSSLIAALAGMI